MNNDQETNTKINIDIAYLSIDEIKLKIIQSIADLDIKIEMDKYEGLKLIKQLLSNWEDLLWHEYYKYIED